MVKAEHKAQTIEWQVCEDEREWQIAQSQQLASVEAVGQRRHWAQRGLLRWGAPSLLVIVLLTLLAGRWLWGLAQRGVDQIEREVEAAVIAEVWSATPSPSADEAAGQGLSFQNGVKMQEDASEVVQQVEILKLGNDWAVIEVLMQPAGKRRSYRQTRAYRYGDRGWVRADASAEYWGEARRLETVHFIFDYNALDEQAVTEAAARLEALYPALTASYYYHLPADGKQMIRVVPEWQPGKIRQKSGNQQVGAETVVVTSPAAMVIPVEIAPSDLLLQSLILTLFNSLSKEAATPNSTSRWLGLHKGFRLWLIWQQELPLAVWRKPIVQWVLSGSQRAAGQMPVTISEHSIGMPEFGHEFCEDYYLWMEATLDIAIPISCWPPADGERKFISWRLLHPSREIPLSLLLYTPDPMDKWTPLELMQHLEPATAAVVLATVLDYVAATHSVEQVPLLVAEIPKHERAETLIPAVLGVSLEQFESGWRAFLHERYGINP